MYVGCICCLYTAVCGYIWVMSIDDLFNNKQARSKISYHTRLKEDLVAAKFINDERAIRDIENKIAEYKVKMKAYRDKVKSGEIIPKPIKRKKRKYNAKSKG